MPSAPPKDSAKKTTGRKPAAKKPAATAAAPTTGNGEEAKYKARISEIQKTLGALAVKAEGLAWEHASAAHYAIKELKRDFDKPLERYYEDLSAGHPWAAATIKKAILACGKLEGMGVADVFNDPASGYTQVCDILNASKLSEDQRGKLLNKVYKHDKKHSGERYTVQDVRGFIKDLAPPEETKRDWLRGTDAWTFSDFDERFGAAGFPGRLPGQAVQNLIHRFSTGVIRFVNVGCGGGTALDVCKDDMNRLVGNQYRGVDIKLSERVKKRHPDNAIEMDCTKPIEHWDRVCDPEWADMVLVTLPLFEFTKTARTSEKTDFSNVIDPEEWLGLMIAAIKGAYSRLNIHGVLAVHSHSISEFERAEPVPDMDWNVARIIQQHTKFFLARPVVQVRKHHAKGSPDDQPWLTPQVEYLHIYRKI